MMNRKKTKMIATIIVILLVVSMVAGIAIQFAY